MIRIHNRSIRGLLVCAAIAACQDIQTPTRDIPPENEMLAQLQVSPRGLTMAVGDVEPMSMTAISVTGDTILMFRDGATTGTVSYPSLDTSRIDIQADGSLRAKKITSGTNPIRVITAWTYRGVTRRDTAYVRINASRPSRPIIGLSIQPPTGDSTKLGYNIARMLSPIVYHDDSSVVANTHVFLYSSRRVRGVAPEAVDPFSRQLTMREKGRIWVYAIGRIYGTTVVDSVEWTGTEPVNLNYNIFPGFLGLGSGGGILRDTVFLAPCGRITVQNSTGTIATGYPIEAILDNPSRIGSCQTGDVVGDFGILQPLQLATRAIPDAGEILLKIFEVHSLGRRQLFEILVKVR